MQGIRPVRLAVVGCGAISDIYLQNMVKRFSILEVVGVCDHKPDAARRTAETHGVRAMTMEQILADESIELVVNLTQPGAHAEVIGQALSAGKHVYTEKTLATSVAQAEELAALATRQGRLLCAAPDTFLGAAAQTARFAVDSGIIGDVSSCVVALNRDAGWIAELFPFTALPGGGIGMDVGIYYATVLLSILGPVEQVCGFWDTRNPQRTHYALGKANFDQPYTLQSENLVSGAFRFASGAQGTLHMNANSTQNEQPQVILYGSQGLMFLPDPNAFGGAVRVQLKGQSEPFTLPPTHAFAENSRGLGVAEMAWALRRGRKPRANQDLAIHAMEMLEGIRISAEESRYYRLHTSFERPAPLPRGHLGEAYFGASEENGLAID